MMMHIELFLKKTNLDDDCRGNRRSFEVSLHCSYIFLSKFSTNRVPEADLTNRITPASDSSMSLTGSFFLNWFIPFRVHYIVGRDAFDGH